jgi:hypothetical protein
LAVLVNRPHRSMASAARAVVSTVS